MILETDFETIAPIWRDHLWKGRKTEILPTSAIRFMGGYDCHLLSQKPVFFKALEFPGSASVVGVISGFSTQNGYFRSRGLYVFEPYRRHGHGHALLQAVADRARASGHSFLWTLPRQSSWAFYESWGFKLASGWFEDGMEFGPNAFASACLHSHPPRSKRDRELLENEASRL